MFRPFYFISVIGLAAVVGPSTAQAAAGSFDLLIRGGTVVDGTGAPRFRADVAIAGDRIAEVANNIEPNSARQVVEANGLIVAPGFIDHHAHIQTTIHQHPLAENFTRQGITTILASLHSGDQPWPLDKYMSELKVAPNIGFFAGHSWARTKVIGLENRAPTAGELEQMKALVEESMKAGALGLSTGLVYVPANYAKTEEVIELAKVAARHGGIYVSHMRDEAAGLLDSVAEVIRIAREARIPGQVQHHKAVGKPQWGWSVKSLAMIDAARKEGLDVTLDMYPYTASSTGSSVLFPQWSLAGGREAFARRAKDPATRAKLEADMKRIFTVERGGADLANIQFRTLPSDRRYDGRTLADLAKDRGLPDTIETGIQLAIELQLEGRLQRDLSQHGRAGRRSNHASPIDDVRYRRRPGRLRHRPSASEKLRHVPSRARPIRSRAEGADAGRSDQADDVDVRRSDRAARARAHREGNVRRPHPVRRGDDRGPDHLHRPASVFSRHSSRDRQWRVHHP